MSPARRLPFLPPRRTPLADDHARRRTNTRRPHAAPLGALLQPHANASSDSPPATWGCMELEVGGELRASPPPPGPRQPTEGVEPSCRRGLLRLAAAPAAKG
jgi:hypothetical protein